MKFKTIANEIKFHKIMMYVCLVLCGANLWNGASALVLGNYIFGALGIGLSYWMLCQFNMYKKNQGILEGKTDDGRRDITGR